MLQVVHIHDCASGLHPSTCIISDNVGYCASMFGAIACLGQGNPEPIDNPAQYASQHKDVTYAG